MTLRKKRIVGQCCSPGSGGLVFTKGVVMVRSLRPAPTDPAGPNTVQALYSLLLLSVTCVGHGLLLREFAIR